MPKKPLEIDMCAGSQLRDTQGEMLSVEGADISELLAGKGRVNDNHGKGFFNSIGRITTAKKIFKEEDCDDDRQKYYWNKVKAPYVYVKASLYDDEDHPNAKAAAAILRNVHKSDCPLKLKASVEGGVIARGIADPSLLARTKIHSVALTFTPANNATLVEPLNLDKSMHDSESDMQLIKSVMHLATTNVPSFRHIARDAAASKVQANMEKIVELMKGDDVSIEIPTKEEILQYALEAKIERNIALIHENVEKALKDQLMGAAMMGAAALSPSASHAQTVAPPPPITQQPVLAAPTPKVDVSNPPKEHQEFHKQLARKNPLLGAIAMVESSGGKNYNHEPINDKGSMHHGHIAGGMFGMMPSAAEYILRNDQKLATKYPDLAEAAKDIPKNHGKFTDRFNNDPQAAADFAEALMKRNKLKTKGDVGMLVHSWNHGLKGTWNKLRHEGPESVLSDDYVGNVLKAYKKIKESLGKVKGKKHKLNKGLTAGYGGAGAPTSRVGGAVLQAESLDVGNGKGFKYITCDDCGKEQIYSKFQVKCRDCGKAWSMNKLHKIMYGSK